MEKWRKPASRDALIVWLSLIAFIYYVISNGIKDSSLILILCLLVIGWYLYIMLFIVLFSGTLGFLISRLRVVTTTTNSRPSLTQSLQYSWVHFRRVLSFVFMMGRLSGGGMAFRSNNINEESRIGVLIRG